MHERLGHPRAGCRLFVPGLLTLLFFGAMFWAKGRDPFERVWFKVRVAGQGKAECIAVLPKMAARPLPVVVYLHGSGGSVLGSGNELRQVAEMGMAGVGMEYEEKAEGRRQNAEIERPSTGDSKERTEDGFDAQFSALLDYVGRQRWADTNRIAWVGFSLGAQRILSFALRHPDREPKLLVRLAGGWVPELDQFKVQGSGFKVRGSAGGLHSVLLVHAEVSTGIIVGKD